jgi:HEAT repeat protein
MKNRKFCELTDSGLQKLESILPQDCFRNVHKSFPENINLCRLGFIVAKDTATLKKILNRQGTVNESTLEDMFEKLHSSLEPEDYRILTYTTKRPISTQQQNQKGAVDEAVNSSEITTSQTFVIIDSEKKNANTCLAWQLDTLRRHCETLARKYEKWNEGFYINETVKKQDILPVFASFYSEYTGCKREKIDLIQTITSLSKVILLGEPGAGKTTSLERISLDYARKFYQEASEVNVVPLPIIIRLSSYTGELWQSVRASLNSEVLLLEDKASTIDLFLRSVKCLIMFDGLNELRSYHQEKIIPCIKQFISTYPIHQYIITSRIQDDLWKCFANDLIEDILAIQPISYKDIINYLELHLGDIIGRQVYSEIPKQLKELLQLPLILWMFKEEISQTIRDVDKQTILINEAGLSAAKLIPKNKGEMYNKFIAKFLLRERQKANHPGKRDIVVKQLLSELAFKMQHQHTLFIPYKEVLDSFAKNLNELHSELSPSILYNETLQNGLLIGEDKIQFTHQTFQEFFAAVALERQYNESTGFQFIQEYAVDTWWNEPLVFLCGLVGLENIEIFNKLVHNIANVNPFLAVRCLIEGCSSSIKAQKIVQEKLKLLVKSNNWVERKNTAEALGKIGDASAVPILSTLLNDPNEDVRYHAAYSLSNIAGSDAETALIQILEDKAWATRIVAAVALGQMKAVSAISYLRPLFLSDQPRERCSATYSLIKMKVRAETPGVLDLLQDEDSRVSASVKLAIKVLNSSRAIDIFSDFIRNESPYIREKAAYLLPRLHPFESAPLIHKLLKDTSKNVLIIAIQSLAELNAVEFIQDGLEFLKHPVPFVREIAAFSCQRFDSNAVVPSLLPLLRDSDDGVRFATVRTLGNLGGSSIFEQIIPLLKDSSEKVRVQAAVALGKLGNVSIDTIYYLESAQEDVSFEVREAAMVSIESIKMRQRLRGFFQGK